MSPKVTIREVAARAGVAAMTVSRVINRSGYVSEDARVRVERAISELGYVPNQLARGLRSKRTGTIALVVTDITNPFFTTMARGVEDAASDTSNLVLFCNTDENEEEEQRYMRLLIEKRVDGVLLVPAITGYRSLQLARAHNVPVVVLDRAVPDGAVDVVRCDSIDGTIRLAKLLLDRGHRGFAVLAGHAGVSTTEERIAAFSRAVTQVDCTNEVAVFYGDFTVESGSENARLALDLDPRPTAIFATNNFISIGALRALRERDVRVPEDMALVGFDDLPPALVSFPFLTVVSQPAYEMGRQAVHQLFRRIADPELIPSEILLPSEIIVRASSG
jgi:LacI family transcriptional regulator